MAAPAAGISLLPRWLIQALQWLVMLLLGASLAWTTLCLGGYRPETMVVTGALNLAIAAVACVLAARGAGRPWQPAALWPVPFLVYALGNALYISPVGWLAWQEWLLWLQMWLLFVVVLHFGRSPAQTRVLLGLAVALAVTATAMAAYQRFVDWEWLTLGRKQLEQYRGRATGPFGIPNSLAAFLELSFLPALAVAVARGVRPPLRWAGAAVAIITGSGIVLSVSRGAFIGLGLTFMLWPLIAGGGWKQRLRRLGVTVAAVAVVSTAIYWLVPIVRTRLEPFLQGKWEASRPILWRVGWQLFLDKPILGTGAASYNILFERHRPLHFGDEPQWTHNDYLNVLSDYGIVGFGFLALAGIGLARSAWRRLEIDAPTPAAAPIGTAARAMRQGLFLGMTAFTLHLFVDFHLRIPALAMWCAVAAGLLVRPRWGDDHNPQISVVWRWPWLAAAGAIAVFGISGMAPVYRAEALRYGPRQLIDEYAGSGKGDLGTLVANANERFRRAAALNQKNAQVWADLAYVVPLQAYLESLKARPDSAALIRLGREAERAARQAVALSEVVPEFWVRLGAALDMQARQGESEAYFKKALALAPRSGRIWYYYAYHLAGIPGREDEARRVIATCLELDPKTPAAVALREHLNGRR